MKYVLRLCRPKVKKTRFAWSLDENKYLNSKEVSKLRRICLKARNQALKENKKLPVRDWFMIELGLNVGLRVKEIAGLKCADLLINDEQSSIRVFGKRGKKRAVKISSEFKNKCIWFLKWKKNTMQPVTPESYVLTSDIGKMLSRRAFQKSFKRCMKNAGLPSHYGIHCLRHTYGSHLYVASNHNLRLVQEQLGHSSVRVTEVYASVMNTDAKMAIEKLYKN